MTTNEFRTAVRKARNVYVYVPFATTTNGPGRVYYVLARITRKEAFDMADERECTVYACDGDIDARVDTFSRDVYIGESFRNAR